MKNSEMAKIGMRTIAEGNAKAFYTEKYFHVMTRQAEQEKKGQRILAENLEHIDS